MISESDWKKFKKIKAAALERFCGTVLKDISEGLASKDNPTNHGKYLYLYRLTTISKLPCFLMITVAQKLQYNL